MLDFTGFEMKIAAARQGDKVFIDTETDVHTHGRNGMYRHPFDDVVQTMDFSQIEAQCARCAAPHAADHPTTCDVYTDFASRKFGVSPENVTLAMRNVAKEHLFSFIYGGSHSRVTR
jgi:DNA polymerase I-like protein with 3'-5' exonuclease and polymerase domains